MTKKDKIAWLLLSPLLTAMAGVILLTSYITITEKPWVALGVVVVVAALVGFGMLQDSEDNY